MEKIRLCKCGCGKEVVIKPHHKYYGIPTYIHGHNPSWIKGKKGIIKHSDKWKKDARERMLGEKNPFYGKTHSEEAKKKIKLFPKGHVPYIKGKHHTKESKLKNSLKHQKGENKYTLGSLSIITNQIRHSVKYKDWRQQIFLRDDFTCQECGKRGYKLEAHHKKQFKELLQEVMEYIPLINLYDACMLYSPMWDINNGITLCQKCHYKKRGIKE